MELTCNKCGHVHFAISREVAELDVESFNKMYEELTTAEKQRYHNSTPVTVEKYEKCFNCGNSHKDVRPAVESDCPIGSTIQAMIEE